MVHKKTRGFDHSIGLCGCVGLTSDTVICRSPATPTKSLPGDGTVHSKDLSDPDVLASIGNRAVKTVSKPASKHFIIPCVGRDLENKNLTRKLL